MENLHSVNPGVAQGSVMGPLIFLLFVNYLANFITDGLIVHFVDYASLSIAHAMLC